MKRTNRTIRECFRAGMTISDDGVVVSHTGRKLTCFINERGYRSVGISMAYHSLAVTIARLLCWKHHGEPPSDDHIVDHIDGDKNNNSPENLRWATYFENWLNVSPEVMEIRARNRMLGPVSQRKLTTRDTLNIRQLRRDGFSLCKIGKLFGVSERTVRRSLLKETLAEVK